MTVGRKKNKSRELHRQSRGKRPGLCFPYCLLAVFTPSHPDASCSLNDATSVDFLKRFSKWPKIVPFHLPDVHSVAILKSDTHFSLISLPLFLSQKLIHFHWARRRIVFFFVTFLLSFFFPSFILSPLTAVSMGPICAHYKCAAFKRKAASL